MVGLSFFCFKSSQRPTDPDERVVLLMGPKASGKTTFISQVDDQTPRPEEGQMSSPASIRDVHVTVKAQGSNRRVVLIDTPGFDKLGSQVTEIGIRKQAKKWLDKKGYKPRLDHILYFTSNNLGIPSMPNGSVQEFENYFRKEKRSANTGCKLTVIQFGVGSLSSGWGLGETFRVEGQLDGPANAILEHIMVGN